jgi:hypothetical protein
LLLTGRKKLSVQQQLLFSLFLPEELFSVEEALKLLAASSGLSGTVLGIFVGQKA